MISALAMTPCETISLEASISPNLREIVGMMQCEKTGTPDYQISNYLQWLNQKEQQELNDVNTPWVYPRGYEPGTMTTKPGKQDGQHTFKTLLPRRAGTLGLMNGSAYMLGGWHPTFAKSGTVARTPIRYTVHIPAGVGGLIGETLHEPGKARTIRGSFTGRFLPIFLTPSFRVWSKGNIRLISADRLPAPKTNRTSPYGIRDMGQDNRISSEKEVLQTIEMLKQQMPALGLRQKPITLVMGPSRKSLVEAFDSGALISDRAFIVLDWERMKRFHRNTLWRFLIQALVLDDVANREAPENVAWVQDIIGASLRDVVYQQIYGEQEWASDVLSKFAVIPEIDALIHAPQITLASTYFLSVDESSGLDVELSRFGTNLSRGKLFQEKLRDKESQEAATELVKRYLAQSGDFLSAAKDQLGDEVLNSLKAWQSPTYPRMDYFLESVTSDGQSTRVGIGLHGDKKFDDQIVVEIETELGTFQKARTGPGLIQFETQAEIGQVTIDPDGRLVEHLHPPGEESRYNNYRHPSWRFLLNNISGLFAVTNQEVSLAADFTLRQIYDQRYRYRFSLHYTPVSIGGSAGLTYSFGPELTALRLSHGVALRAAYAYLRDEGIELPTGHLGRLTASYAHDTRLSPYFAFNGHGWNMSASSGYHRLGDSQGFYGSLGGSVFGILPLAGRQGLLGRLRFDVMAGDVPEQARLRLGGLYRGARGYESDAARSDVFRGLGTIEHRHAFFTGAKIDFWGALMWTRLEGALFANATFLPDHDTSCSSPLFFDAGYGLRFIGDVLNISPAAIVVDVGIPLNPCAKRSEHQPVTVYISFVQSLAGF